MHIGGRDSQNAPRFQNPMEIPQSSQTLVHPQMLYEVLIVYKINGAVFKGKRLSHIMMQVRILGVKVNINPSLEVYFSTADMKHDHIYLPIRSQW